MLSRILSAAMRPSPRRVADAKRGFSKYVDPKNTWGVWMGDPGAYPVMISIVGASALCVWFNWRLFTQQPRIAWDRSRREKEMFKETEEAALNYTNNVFRKMGKEAYMKKLLGSKPVQDKTDYAAQQ